MLPTLCHPPLANIVIKFVVDGGPIMYPIIVVAFFATCVLVERVFWWLRFASRRSPRQLDQVYAALEAGNQAKAISLSEQSRDPVIRMIHHG
ncbi:MAG: MotA/TolQ/ExbB proton channel family protein, partial [Prosthecobacter sp.]|nr:MotA/TolQ/ExbB proton channel family protein [Prosthecobacter sp.]